MFALRSAAPFRGRSLGTYLTSLAFFAAVNGCGMPRQSGTPESYIEDGELWAYGSVQVAELDGPGSVMLKRNAGVQTLDSGTVTEWSLVGTLPGGDQRDLAYVDYHPSLDRLLAYSYQIDVSKRPYEERFDVFALLQKAGRSYFQRQRVFLGTATFGAGGDTASMELGDGLKMSLIANGVFSGQWALHYPEVTKVVVRPWQGMCPKTPTQSPGQGGQGAPGQGPGQNPGQNPGQFDFCRPLPPEKDLCSGDPTQTDCRPPLPTPATGGSGEVGPERNVTGLESQGGNVYVMNGDVHEAKMVFVSATLTTDGDEANADLCSRKFFAVARSVDGRVNQACILTPAPASPEGGKVACGLTVRFDRAQTFLERVCDVTALFKEADVQKVQILKR